MPGKARIEKATATQKKKSRQGIDVPGGFSNLTF